MSPLSFVSPSSCLSLFFSLSFAGLSPTFSFSLLLLFFAFQICGHDDKSKLNTLDNADTETISAFRFRLYRLFSLPHNTRVAMRFPAKITSSCHTCMWLSYFTLVCLWSRRTGGRLVIWLPKFIGCIGYQIILRLVLRCARLARARAALWKSATKGVIVTRQRRTIVKTSMQIPAQFYCPCNYRLELSTNRKLWERIFGRRCTRLLWSF